uniref:Uncharacterized protein n=1 Tax=Rhizobium rhizogenes TaxID=359 RepID=A0A7S5DS29_RHIRH|nr:hypothetical protein pC5.8d_743 [Rhizobium rhizogenes]
MALGRIRCAHLICIDQIGLDDPLAGLERAYIKAAGGVPSGQADKTIETSLAVPDPFSDRPMTQPACDASIEHNPVQRVVFERKIGADLSHYRADLRYRLNRDRRDDEPSTPARVDVFL